MDSETTAHLQRLMDKVRFTAEELEANRKGLIPDSQVIKLELTALSGTYAALFVIGLFVLLALGVLMGKYKIDLFPIGWCIILPNIGFLIVLTRRIWRALKGDLELRWAASIEGKALGLFPPIGRSLQVLKVQKMTFRISQEVGREIKRGKRYRVYYSEHSHTVLSIEPLEPEPKNKESGSETALHHS